MANFTKSDTPTGTTMKQTKAGLPAAGRDLSGIASDLLAQGRLIEARDLLTREVQNGHKALGNHHFHLARIYCRLRDSEKALEMLYSAISAGYSDLDGLLTEPAFKTICTHIKFGRCCLHLVKQGQPLKAVSKLEDSTRLVGLSRAILYDNQAKTSPTMLVLAQLVLQGLSGCSEQAKPRSERRVKFALGVKVCDYSIRGTCSPRIPSAY